MATITFNAAQRAAERLEAVLTAVGEKFDVFVSYQLRQTAAEAEPARTLPATKLQAPPRRFGRLTPASSAMQFRHSSSAATATASGSPATRRGGSAGFSCSRLPQCRSQREQSGPVGCATIFPADRFELDLRNNGSPLIPFLRPLMRLALHLQRRALAGAGQIAAAIERRKKA